MELHATPALMMAAPILLGVRPAGHPAREASITVVDATLCMSHSMSHDMCVDMVAAMPGSRASHAPVITAPGLLVRGPSKVPVRVAGVAVKGKAARRLSVDHLKEKQKKATAV